MLAIQVYDLSLVRTRFPNEDMYSSFLQSQNTYLYIKGGEGGKKTTEKVEDAFDELFNK